VIFSTPPNHTNEIADPCNSVGRVDGLVRAVAEWFHDGIAVQALKSIIALLYKKLQTAHVIPREV
jgi:hypothetical protein